MNANYIFNIILVAISAYMLFRIFRLSGRGKMNQKMLAILDQIDQEETFFEEADRFIETEKDAEFVQKVSVLRLWGDTFYERNDAFRQHLDELNLETLLNPNGKQKGFSSNEDSFFYLYMAIPNRLNYRKAEGLRKLVDEKLAAVAETNSNTLLKKLYEENKKYYDNTEDRGIPFMKSFLEGEYGGYSYSKQLIGLYKSCEEAILAKVYLEEGNTEGYDTCMKELENFGKNTRLGIRWLKEVGIAYPEEPEETEAAEETAETEKTAEKETNE